jgi:lipoyl synthase
VSGSIVAPVGAPLPMAVERRLPPWITVAPPRAQYPEVRALLEELHLGTVCREARCPNLSECWSRGAATIMLLGTHCTRRCGFCAVGTRWPLGRVDGTEPARVAEAVRRWGLRYVVLTQVCRDDLADGGAAQLAATVAEVRRAAPSTLVELLIGDLGGSSGALATVLAEPPDVLAHNLETVARLSPRVRDRRAGYARSLELLARARRFGATPPVTKSSIMLGLGETDAELGEAFRDLRRSKVELLTLGQYLAPTPAHHPVERFVTPEAFAALATRARAEGFAAVAAGPLVRSSYRAEELYRSARPGGA